MANIGTVDLIIIQGSPFCNIDCKYCYLLDRSSKKKISIETIEKIFIRLIEDDLIDKEVSIVWHAGEPLALPLTYYVEIFDRIVQILPKETVIKHHIQTNAMLISQEWCDFIKLHNIRVGVSIDGPKFINDLFRLGRKEQSTFDKTMNGILKLKENAIPFHAIAVASADSLNYANEIYDFFIDLGVDQLGINIEEIEGIHKNSSLEDNDDTYLKVKSFFRNLYYKQLKSEKKLLIRELEYTKLKLLSIPLNYFSENDQGQQTKAFRIISVDVDGNFSTFSPELLGQKNEEFGDFILGNVHQNRFSETQETTVFKKLSEDIALGIKECEKSCEYFSFCGGGAPANKYYENGSFASTETLYCKYTVKAPFDVVLEELEKAV